MRDMNWVGFVEEPYVLKALRKLDPKAVELSTKQRKGLIREHAKTIFTIKSSDIPGMDGSLSVLEWDIYYIFVDQAGDCYGPAYSFQEVIDSGVLQTTDDTPVIECSLSDEETFAAASTLVELEGNIVVNGEKMVMNEETLTPDWRAAVGEERDGLICVGSGDHCDYFTWDEAAEWLQQATDQFTQLRDGIAELGGSLETFEEAPCSYESLVVDTLGLELYRYFYDRGPGRSGYEIYAWGDPGSNAQDWVEIYANIVDSLKSRLPNDVDTDEIGDDLDGLFNLLREHDVRF